MRESTEWNDRESPWTKIYVAKCCNFFLGEKPSNGAISGVPDIVHVFKKDPRVHSGNGIPVEL